MTEKEQVEGRNQTGDGVWTTWTAVLRHSHCAGTRRYGPPRLGIPLQPLQIRPHVGCVLIAKIAVFLQRLINDAFQFGGTSRLKRISGGGSESRIALKMTPELSP